MTNKKHNQYMMLACVSGCFLVHSVGCNAADWTPIKKTKHYELQVDMDSYNQTDGLPLISTKQVFYKPQKLMVSHASIIYSESHTSTQFDCKRQLYKVLSTQVLSQQNKRFTPKNLAHSAKLNESFQPILRGSDHETTASLVCQVHRMLGGD